jgi:hypothetical protein
MLISHILFLKKPKITHTWKSIAINFFKQKASCRKPTWNKSKPSISRILHFHNKLIKELINSYKTRRFHAHKILKTSQLTIMFIIEFVYIRIS